MEQRLDSLAWPATWAFHFGPGSGLIQAGKQALDAARGASVFTVGAFVVHRPGPTN
ncbi:hypothetical protein ACWEGX_27130 [Streptomyces chartreusis]